MIHQASKPVNKRIYVYHISYIYRIETALKKPVWGVYATHKACFIIIINSLKDYYEAKRYSLDAY